MRVSGRRSKSGKMREAGEYRETVRPHPITLSILHSSVCSFCSDPMIGYHFLVSVPLSSIGNYWIDSTIEVCEFRLDKRSFRVLKGYNILSTNRVVANWRINDHKDELW